MKIMKKSTVFASITFFFGIVGWFKGDSQASYTYLSATFIILGLYND